jgi:small subunit ribosomal protein S6
MPLSSTFRSQRLASIRGQSQGKEDQTMRQYEVAYIVHPELDETAFKDINDRISSLITDSGGKIDKVDMWGKKKLAYEIRKQTEGQYVFLHATLPPTFCAELERSLGLLEPVLRFMIISAE